MTDVAPDLPDPVERGQVYFDDGVCYVVLPDQFNRLQWWRQSDIARKP